MFKAPVDVSRNRPGALHLTRSQPLGRRGFVRSAAGSGLAPAVCVAEANSARPAHPGRQPSRDNPARSAVITASYLKAIVETAAGTVQGYVSRGIFTFKGIPYGAPSDGPLRFMPSDKPQPWGGVRECLRWGHRCPAGVLRAVPEDNLPHREEDQFLLYRQTGLSQGSEDCLRLNVWTPSLSSSDSKRPAMVYLHGGFSGRSSNDLLSYDGENLRQHGDVVVITHNDRLNVFGYFNLSDFGDEQYATSANVGMLDIVAVLEGVRDNIANFGGDPANVMIFGQSGGGAKISTLMAMPRAKGLFQRAAIESGSMLRARNMVDLTRHAAAILSRLNLSKSQLHRFTTIPTEPLSAAAESATGRNRCLPKVDGKILPREQFDPDAPSISAQVPMLIGANLNEFVNGVDNPEVSSFAKTDLMTQLKPRCGTKTFPIVTAYRHEYPGATPFELYAAISASDRRRSAFTQAECKAAFGAALGYQYLFAWRTPMLNGRPGSFHSCEIAFVFDNTGLCVNYTGGDPEAVDLSARVSQAWVHFARHGDPESSRTTEMASIHTREKGHDDLRRKCIVKNDLEREGLRIISEMRPIKL